MAERRAATAITSSPLSDGRPYPDGERTDDPAGNTSVASAGAGGDDRHHRAGGAGRAGPGDGVGLVWPVRHEHRQHHQRDHADASRGSGAEAGATVTLFDADALTVGSAVVSGAQQLTHHELGAVRGGPHPDGDADRSVPATPAWRLPAWRVTIDTTAPAAPSAPDLATASDSGLVRHRQHHQRRPRRAFTGSGVKRAQR